MSMFHGYFVLIFYQIFKIRVYHAKSRAIGMHIVHANGHALAIITYIDQRVKIIHTKRKLPIVICIIKNMEKTHGQQGVKLKNINYCQL